MDWRYVIDFWFKEVGPQGWFTKSPKIDARIRRRFLGTYQAVVRGEREDWRTSVKGRLAEIIVLDQFARHLYRAKPAAFTHDPLALVLAQEAIRADADKKLSKTQRLFLYMPFMHSESKLIQKRAVKLFEELGNPEGLWFEKEHRKIIDRFGRFPHRNKVLGRRSTPEERKFLKTHKGF